MSLTVTLIPALTLALNPVSPRIRPTLHALGLVIAPSVHRLFLHTGGTRPAPPTVTSLPAMRKLRSPRSADGG